MLPDACQHIRIVHCTSRRQQKHNAFSMKDNFEGRSAGILEPASGKKSVFNNEFHHLCYLGVQRTATPLAVQLAEPVPGPGSGVAPMFKESQSTHSTWLLTPGMSSPAQICKSATTSSPQPPIHLTTTLLPSGPPLSRLPLRSPG